MNATKNPSDFASRHKKSRSAQADTDVQSRQAEQHDKAESDAVIPFPPQDPGSDPLRESALPESDPSAADVLPLSQGTFGMPLDNESEAAITSVLERARSEACQAACLWLRIRRYGVEEEIYGQKVGLVLMQRVEARLGECLRGDDVLRRVTNNEFVIVLNDPDSAAGAASVAARLQAHCSGIYRTAGLRLPVMASVGIAMYPGDAATAHDLLRYARMALREVNPQSQIRYHCFSPELLTRLRDRAWMIAELERALEQDRLVLHYQPQYAFENERVVGVEALVRMVSESGELIGPNHFIELAEETNQILELGRWVIEQACQQLGRWQQAGVENVRMAVNVSPRQLMEDDFCDIVDAAVARAGIRHNDLELEITERQVIENLTYVEQTLRKLTAQGVRVAVDDFGTGYSSLAYLMQLSISSVKIDRAFMARVPADERAGRVVNVIITMAGQLGLEHTVEGIETDAQHHFLLESGCERGQGYNFARPQTAAAIERLLF